MSDRIGILTFHTAVNYGAVLQAYATQRFIAKQGYDAEIIDYHCPKFSKDYKTFQVYRKNIQGIIKAIIKAPVIHRKKKRFASFLRRNVKVSPAYDETNISACNAEYGLFIAGSDQVWNLRLTGCDRNYLLRFVADSKKKASYAASMGGLDLDKKSEEILINDLKDFANISVRESDAAQYLRKVLNREVETVLDPVFLLDSSDWDKIATPVESAPYILAYCLHERDVYRQAQLLAQKTGLKIKCIQNNAKKPIEAEYILDAGPDDFVGLVKNAEYVVTDSFHGAAFGIIYRKQIRVVLKTRLSGLNGRLMTLLESFNVSNAIAAGENETGTRYSQVIYDNRVIDGCVNRSRDHLLALLKEHAL